MCQFFCSGYGCDACGLSIVTHRFHSSTKADFDLCLGCFRKEEEKGCVTTPHNHTIIQCCMILAILFSPSNRDEWMVYLLSEQPATGMANKFLSHETGTGRAIAMLWDVCVCVWGGIAPCTAHNVQVNECLPYRALNRIAVQGWDANKAGSSDGPHGVQPTPLLAAALLALPLSSQHREQSQQQR